MAETHPRNLPRDVFVHLLMIATLYAAVGAFIALLFQYVNIYFPDVLTTYEPTVRDSVRRSEAILFVVFPCFLFLSWLIERDAAASPALREFKVRKWLIYFTLFVSAIAIITDLVVLIYNFLGGDLTTPFVLKIFIVLLTAAAVFGYYLWDLRRGRGRSAVPRLAAFASAAVVAACLVAGFFLIGSPALERSRRFDDQRVQNLAEIQSQIVSYWTRKGEIPASLDDLADSISGFRPPADPETGLSYEYRATGPLGFELCASFTTDSTARTVKGMPLSPATPRPLFHFAADENWRHGTGRACFERAIDPELYRPLKQPSQ